MLDLKKQLLEKENRFLRERRELQLELEKERASWKKKEMMLSERIRSLDAKSAQSSASSISPSATPQPSDEAVHESKDIQRPHAMESQQRRTSASGHDASSKYDNFQKTVDNALKQIEKISKDLNDIESPKPDALQERRRASLTPSPLPGSPARPFKNASPESDPSVTAPWRTKKRSTTIRPQLMESPTRTTDFPRKTSQQPETNPQGGPGVHGSEFLLPAINTAQIKMASRSPNPQRKVKKIDSRGSQMDVTVSSPDSNPQDGAAHSSDHVLSDNTSPVGISGAGTRAPSKVNSPGYRNHTSGSSTSYSTPVDHRNSPGGKVAMRKEGDLVRFGSPLSQEGTNLRSSSRDSLSKSGVGIHNVLNVDEKGGGKVRSSSPRLPKLHQQLLFKDVAAEGRANSPREYSASEGRKMSADESKLREDRHFEPATRTGRVTGRVTGQRGKASMESNAQPAKTDTKYPKPHIGGALVSFGTSLVQGDKTESVAPPAIHPKPKVSIHKDLDGSIVRVSPSAPQEPPRKFASPDSLPVTEKPSTIAGRVGNVGKAGRDWIRKKLSFREKKGGEEVESDEKATPTANVPEETKRHKPKSRLRHSALLRNGKHSGKAGNRRSVTFDQRSTSEETTESDREERKRESFLRRSRRKAKKAAESKEGTPTKSRPKKYTRSKTEATPKDMKNFLAKFKASQGNPHKPSVVKQFERRLLENEVKTIQELETGPKTQEREMVLNEAAEEEDVGGRKKSLDEGYSGEDEGDYDNWSRGDFSPMNTDKSVTLPTISSDRDGSPADLKSALRVGKKGPPVKPKTYHRRSMSDFKHFENANNAFGHPIAGSSNIVSRRRRDRTDPKFTSELPTIHSPSSAAQEADVLCSKKSVSSLVSKFSSIKDTNEDRVPEQSMLSRGAANRHSSREQELQFGKTSPHDGALQRSRSMSSHDATKRYGRKRDSVTFSQPEVEDSLEPADVQNEVPSHRHTSRSAAHSWLDRVMSKPSESELNGDPIPANKDFVQPTRTSAPPGQYDFLDNSFLSAKDAHDEDEVSPRQGRKKMMSQEMRRKAEMLEKALVKGPRRPRRYRRADTQPVQSFFYSTDDDISDEDISDVEGDLNRAFHPFISDFRKTDPLRNVDMMTVDMDQDTESLHPIIPPVTTKFSKPTRPGRLPSRWAR